MTLAGAAWSLAEGSPTLAEGSPNIKGGSPTLAEGSPNIKGGSRNRVSRLKIPRSLDIDNVPIQSVRQNLKPAARAVLLPKFALDNVVQMSYASIDADTVLTALITGRPIPLHRHTRRLQEYQRHSQEYQRYSPRLKRRRPYNKQQHVAYRTTTVLTGRPRYLQDDHGTYRTTTVLTGRLHDYNNNNIRLHRQHRNTLYITYGKYTRQYSVYTLQNSPENHLVPFKPYLIIRAQTLKSFG